MDRWSLNLHLDSDESPDVLRQLAKKLAGMSEEKFKKTIQDVESHFPGPEGICLCMDGSSDSVPASLAHLSAKDYQIVMQDRLRIMRLREMN